MYFNKIILPVLAVALNTVNAQLIDPIDMTDGHWSIDTRNSTYPVVRFHGALEATDAPAPPGHPHRRWGDFPAPNDAETRCHEWEIGPNDGDFFTNLVSHGPIPTTVIPAFNGRPRRCDLMINIEILFSNAYS
jgi:hypothetical protein